MIGLPARAWASLPISSKRKLDRLPSHGRAPHHSQTGNGHFNQCFADCGCIETEHIAYGVEREDISFVRICDPHSGVLCTSMCVQSSRVDSAASETFKCILKDGQHQPFYRRQILVRTPPAIKPARRILLWVGHLIRCANESLLIPHPFLILKLIREFAIEDQSGPTRQHCGT